MAICLKLDQLEADGLSDQLRAINAFQLLDGIVHIGIHSVI
jgi:hypothetical protein